MEEMRKKFKLGTLVTGLIMLLILIYYFLKEYNIYLLYFIIGVICFLVILSIFYKWWILFLFAIFIVIGNSFLENNSFSLKLMCISILILSAGGAAYYDFPILGGIGISGKDEKYFLDYLVKYWWVASIAIIVVSMLLIKVQDGMGLMLFLYPIPITTYGYAMLRYKKACEKRKKAIWPMVNP